MTVRDQLIVLLNQLLPDATPGQIVHFIFLLDEEYAKKHKPMRGHFKRTAAQRR